MAPADDEWAEPHWERLYNKHHPVAGVLWGDVVVSTGMGQGKQHGKATAKYGPHPQITAVFIEQIEMAAVADKEKELPRPKPHVRAFWHKLDQVVGANNGQETEYIYVEWHQNGAVHGRPMTRQELVKKGMPQ